MRLIFTIFLFLHLSSMHTTMKAELRNPQENQTHELTVFVVPTKYPLDWSSPSSIYKSMRKCYVRSLGQKVNYLLGHVAMRMESPFLEESPYYFAQMSLSTKEKTKLIYKDRVGMGIMGITLGGEIEPGERLQSKLAYYAKKDMVTFITFRISDNAAKRAIEYINHYTGKSNNGFTTSKYYNGAFWPRYKEEGGACSTFAMSVLDVINLLEEEYIDAWKIERKIPMELVGGQLNNGHKVKTSDIKNTHAWYDGEGEVNEAYAPYFVYEPNEMFNWIMEQRANDSSKFKAISDEEGLPGLYIDVTDVAVDSQAPLFLKRQDKNMFIDYHKQQVESISKNIAM